MSLFVNIYTLENVNKGGVGGQKMLKSCQRPSPFPYTANTPHTYQLGVLRGQPTKLNQKYENLQYNTLVCQVDGTLDSLTKRLTFKNFFFIISYKLRALKTDYFHFCNFIEK